MKEKIQDIPMRSWDLLKRLKIPSLLFVALWFLGIVSFVRRLFMTQAIGPAIVYGFGLLAIVFIVGPAILIGAMELWEPW